MSDELPAGWSWKRLEEIVDDGPRNGVSPPTSGKAHGPLALKLSATTTGEMLLSQQTTKHLDAPVPPDSHAWLEPGDLLVQRANTLQYLGAAAIYDGPPHAYVYPDLMMRIRIADPDRRKFVWRYLNGQQARSYFRARATGTAGNMPKINGTTLRAVPVPVPPPDEAGSIVRTLDALSVRSRRAKDALDAVPALLDRLRQSILAAAFRGDLTADWREQNPDAEPASELLTGIRLERRKRWEEAELVKLLAKGKRPVGDGWKGKYAEPERPVEDALPALPPSWAWAAMDEVTDPVRTIAYGILKAIPVATDGVPVVRVADVKDGRINEGALQLCRRDHAGKFARSTLAQGDLVVTKDGTIGRVAIVPPSLAGANVSQHVLRVAPAPEISSEFLMRMVEAPSSQRWMRGETRGVALQGVNVGDFRRMPVPVAPLAEQAEVARALAAAFARIARLEGAAETGRALVVELEDGVLAAAFRGELATP